MVYQAFSVLFSSERSYSSSSPVALQKLRKNRMRIRRYLMKSLLTLLTYHLLFSSLFIFIIISGNLPIYETVLVLVFIPALNKGLTYLKIDSPKTRILNLALFFMILSFLSLPQLTLISSNWKYYILLTIAILSSITYLYYLYQFVKETK